MFARCNVMPSMIKLHNIILLLWSGSVPQAPLVDKRSTCCSFPYKRGRLTTRFYGTLSVVLKESLDNVNGNVIFLRGIQSRDARS